MIGPLEVVQDQREGAHPRDRRERVADLVEQRGAVGHRFGLVGRGQESERGDAFRHAGERSRRIATKRTEQRADRSQRGRVDRGRCRAHREQVRSRQHGIDERGLAHAGVARDEHDRAFAGCGGLSELLKRRFLSRATDQIVHGVLAVPAHGEASRRRGAMYHPGGGGRRTADDPAERHPVTRARSGIGTCSSCGTRPKPF